MRNKLIIVQTPIRLMPQENGMDRFSELNAFIAVVEAGGFSAAARRRGEGQPAISKAIAALEKRLGVALLNRSTRSVTLTDQGQRYYDRAKPLVDEMDDIDNEMTNSTLSVTGLVRISVASTFGRLHILPLIPELLSVYPGLEVDLVLSDSCATWWGIGLISRSGLVLSMKETPSPGAWLARLWFASDL